LFIIDQQGVDVMSFNRKPPSVYRAKHRQRNGGYFLDSFFTFKVMHQGKVIYEKTKFTKKRDAQSYVNNIFSSQENFKTFLDKHFNKEDNITDDTSEKPESVLSILKTQGWLNWETNPKLLNHKKQGKNYGSRHAKNIMHALSHIFVETDQYKWFSSKAITAIGRKDAQTLSSELWKNRTYRKVLCEGNPELKDTIGSYKLNIIALKTFFTYCFDEVGIIDINPFHKIKIPKSQNRKTKSFFSQKQLRIMFDLKYLSSLNSEKRWEKFLKSDYFKSFFFTALTGLRSGEARALKWKQITNDIILTVDRAFKENTTQEKDIDTPKWGKVRTIVLCDTAYKIIKDMEPKNAEEFIFKNSVGNAIDASTWCKKFKYFISILEDNLILLHSDFTSHSFRGTLNSLLLKNGNVSGPLIRKYLGWSENNTLTAVQENHYTEFYENDILKVADAIELLYSGNHLQWELISSEEKKDIALDYAKLNDYKDLIWSGDPISKTRKLDVLMEHRSWIFKTLNNIILFDDNLAYEARVDLISHCKKILKMDTFELDDLGVAFSQEFKQYIRSIWEYVPESVKLSISIILETSLDLYKKELED
jgi:integrase